MIEVFSLSQSGQFLEATGLEAAMACRHQGLQRLWINLDLADLEAMPTLATAFDLHPVELRDVTEQCRLPKLTIHGDYSFLALHRIFYDFSDESCEFRGVYIFFSGPWIITLHHSKLSRTMHAIKDRLRQQPTLMLGDGSGLILLNILEGIVNDYQPVVSEWQEELNIIESMVLKERDENVIDRILKFKKLVTVLRKHLSPQKMVITQLYERFRPGHGDDQLAPFFKNALEEMGNLLRELDSVSAHATSVFETYAALLSLDLNHSTHKLNQVMQRLNLLSAVFLPLTFIVGVYGMNIHEIPELQWHGFYYLLWAFMILLAGGMLYLFRRMKWY